MIEYLHYYLAKMEFYFVWIKRLLFGFCSNQCWISVVKISKTHTMVVHFSGRCRPKRKKTENTTVLELWSLSPEIITESSLFFLVYLFWCCMLCSTSMMLYVVFHQHINYIIGYSTEQTNILSQNDRWCLFNIASFWLLICFSIFLLIIISLSFLQRSFQFLLIVLGAVVLVDCTVRFEYFEYCLLIIITREFFHRKQILFSKLMEEYVIFLWVSSIFFFSLSAFSLNDAFPLSSSSFWFNTK